MAVEKWMAGPMALLCDTSRSAPIRINRVDYLPPTNQVLVKFLYEQVLSEGSQRLTGLKAIERVRRFEERRGLIAREGEV